MNEDLARRIASTRARLAELPRVQLAALPTPLDDCPRLSAKLAGPRVLIKRDDLTGLAFGGNKVRQHEYVLGAAVAAGADCLVQGAAAQSNHSRQLAAAGARLGLETFLLPKLDSLSSPVQGNYLVDHILGASISPIAVEDSTIAAKSQLVEQLRAEGRRPYVTGMGSEDSLVLAAVAYVEALFEIIEQLPAGANLDAIYTASQGSTQVGLLLGCEILGLPTRVVGIAPLGADHEAFIPPADILDMVHAAAHKLGLESQIGLEDIDLRDEFAGEGYGIPTQAGLDAIALLGRNEGILLDPVYTGKAFSGLLADIEDERIPHDGTVVFIHTGGLPAIFAYPDPILTTLARTVPISSTNE